MVMAGTHDMVDSKIFGKLLRVAMIWNDISAEELAQIIYREGYSGSKNKPVDPQTIRSWMRGELSNPGISLMNVLSKALNVPRIYWLDPNPFKYESVNFKRSRGGFDLDQMGMIHSDGPNAHSLLTQHRTRAGSSVVEHRTFNSDNDQIVNTPINTPKSTNDLIDLL